MQLLHNYPGQKYLEIVLNHGPWFVIAHLMI